MEGAESGRRRPGGPKQDVEGRRASPFSRTTREKGLEPEAAPTNGRERRHGGHRKRPEGKSLLSHDEREGT
jgi:hypothetical protein